MKIRLIAVLSSQNKLLTGFSKDEDLCKELDACRLDQMQQADAVVAGRKTVEIMWNWTEEMREAMKRSNLLALSTTKKEMEGAKACFASLEALMQYLEQQEYTNVVVMGGLQTFELFMNSRLATESINIAVPSREEDNGVFVNFEKDLPAYEIYDTEKRGKLLFVLWKRKRGVKPTLTF